MARLLRRLLLRRRLTLTLADTILRDGGDIHVYSADVGRRGLRKGAKITVDLR